MKIVALAGGVGGAKLVHGFSRVLPPEDLTIIVNTGDDFIHLGLKICPDLDTVCYTLAGIANPVTGWGQVDETWHALECVERLGGPSWFQLGDRDLGTHLERTRRLKNGESLSHITESFCETWGIKAAILPMSDVKISTIVLSDQGDLPFQEYFVNRRCRPQVKGFIFDGSEDAVPAPGVIPAIANADLVVICPSNPWVSIDPILNVPGIKEAMLLQKEKGLRVLAVSPIIGGQAIKGPVAKMYQEMGIEPSALAVADHYRNLLDIFVFDIIDYDLITLIEAMNLEALALQTIMKSVVEREQLAFDILGKIS